MPFIKIQMKYKVLQNIKSMSDLEISTPQSLIPFISVSLASMYYLPSTS